MAVAFELRILDYRRPVWYTFWTEAGTNHVAQRYPVGSEQSVRYDPGDFSRIKIMSQYWDGLTGNLLFLGMGAACGVLGTKLFRDARTYLGRNGVPVRVGASPIPASTVPITALGRLIIVLVLAGWAMAVIALVCGWTTMVPGVRWTLVALLVLLVSRKRSAAETDSRQKGWIMGFARLLTVAYFVAFVWMALALFDLDAFVPPFLRAGRNAAGPMMLLSILALLSIDAVVHPAPRRGQIR